MDGVTQPKHRDPGDFANGSEHGWSSGPSIGSGVNPKQAATLLITGFLMFNPNR